ncbi:MAG: site-2 protease family protein [Firmicutes bacterium]|nr:site-2 protease family protein [Bacillota bacterium]
MFLVMVSLHEFGHYIVGKLLNFKILEYSIGFGPKIFSKTKGETAYSLRCIPLGGYCKFEGEEEESGDPRAFANQKVWKRMLVIVAGGFSNIVLGFVIFLILVPLTSPFATNVVDTVVENSYVADEGLQSGDEIIKIDGKRVSFYNDISLAASMFDKDTETTIVVKRGGEKRTLTFKPTEDVTTYIYTEDGIEVEQSINGIASETLFYAYGDEAVYDESKVGTTETTTRYIIGFRPTSEDVTIFNVWGEAYHQTKFVVKLVYQSLWQMITGKVGLDQMSGPVGIVQQVSESVHSGSQSYLYVLNLAALLTINLGLFNLLPIPALDGGKFFFMLVELIRRKPVPPEKEAVVHLIGMALLVIFVIFVSMSDISKLING